MPRIPDRYRPEPADFSAQDLARLQTLLDSVPEPLQPLDISALDGFLCAVLVQPGEIPAESWLPCVTDLEARALPPGFDATALHAMVLRRHGQLRHAIAARQWFDPWVFELDGPATVSECVLPWVAGFAAALERFPRLTQTDDPRLLEPLALIHLHFDEDDLEDADALQQTIDTIEPPADLAEAVQDLVRSVMLLADITHPVKRDRPSGSRRTGRRSTG